MVALLMGIRKGFLLRREDGSMVEKIAVAYGRHIDWPATCENRGKGELGLTTTGIQGDRPSSRPAISDLSQAERAHGRRA